VDLSPTQTGEERKIATMSEDVSPLVNDAQPGTEVIPTYERPPGYRMQMASPRVSKHENIAYNDGRDACKNDLAIGMRPTDAEIEFKKVEASIKYLNSFTGEMTEQVDFRQIGHVYEQHFEDGYREVLQKYLRLEEPNGAARVARLDKQADFARQAVISDYPQLMRRAIQRAVAAIPPTTSDYAEALWHYLISYLEIYQTHPLQFQAREAVPAGDQFRQP
jgi:hypothetical protein